MAKRSRVGTPEILLLLVSLLVAFGLIEAAARRAFLLPHSPSADGWWEVTWLKRRGQYGSRGGQDAIDKFHPVLGWTLRENLRDAPLLSTRVNSNSQGVRGRREYSTATTRARTRVVVIGDSYTFGEGVNDDETFSAVLERLLPDSEVLNLGVHGYGTDQQWLRLQIDGLKYRPDLVVLGYYEDDIARNRLSFRDYAKPHFSLVDGRLVPDNLPIPSPEAFSSRIHLRSLGYLDILWTSMREPQLDAENGVRSRRILDEIFSAARSVQAVVVQLYLPTPDQVRANEREHPGLFSYGCAAANVVCVDPTPALHRAVSSSSDGRALFRYHYAPELHQVIAQELARVVEAWRARHGS